MPEQAQQLMINAFCAASVMATAAESTLSALRNELAGLAMGSTDPETMAKMPGFEGASAEDILAITIEQMPGLVERLRVCEAIVQQAIKHMEEGAAAIKAAQKETSHADQ